MSPDFSPGLSHFVSKSCRFASTAFLCSSIQHGTPQGPDHSVVGYYRRRAGAADRPRCILPVLSGIAQASAVDYDVVVGERRAVVGASSGASEPVVPGGGGSGTTRRRIVRR